MGVEDGLEDEGEEVFAEHSASGSGGDFDEVIGAIEDIVVDDRFQDIQHNLMEKYSHHFEDTEENKLIYTEIHQIYTTEIETYIETELSQRFTEFSMERFLHQLEENREVLDGDIFDLLYSLSDFLVFKELFVDY